MTDDDATTRWFLSAPERGNPHTRLDSTGPAETAWTVGNQVEPVVHGAPYFQRLHDQVRALHPGDQIFFTDWRGDSDEQLLPGGPTVRALLCDAARAGVAIHGLLWRSHSDHMSFSGQQNLRLGMELNEAGGQALLDQRVRRFGSHHQKLVVLRHPAEPGQDVAYVGGIDLCHSRRDDADHHGDPQPQPMDKRYGDRVPWHDMTLEVRGPAVAEVLETFAERWDDPRPLDRRTPYRMLLQRRAHMPRRPAPLPARTSAPPACGEHAVQVLRTYSQKRPSFPFAPHGERSIARAYTKAFGLARSLIYIEDQYLWSPVIARGIADALRRSPALQVIAVVPRFPDSDGAVLGPMNRLGQLRAMALLQAAAPDRVGVFDIENAAGIPIYVHAKTCIVDDVWFTCGSDNFNRRSWTSDSEITCAVLDGRRDDREPRELDAYGDGARLAARALRLTLWAEHLRLADDDPALRSRDLLGLWRARAGALDDWHARGCGGPRPPGQARRHEPAPVSARQRLFAAPMYALVADPDGRSWRLRHAKKF